MTFDDLLEKCVLPPANVMLYALIITYMSLAKKMDLTSLSWVLGERKLLHEKVL